ncbi:MULTISPECIES: segregation and condensation protein A [Agrobacterium]|jgi:segregation and condensation protein A|uniref:Segregation and condensation protein A n=1 Tax=Agrobacterium salinitolerans TaxID=1183413 RepID=A0A1S9EYJ0_9HYPH|nr:MULTISPECIES: ScpA family protein [Agrobacterium]MBA4777706.1 segregation/condensation protein A [Hyphomicrobiales bacterium]PNQ24574.1 segregation/condensation protein A [Rhizobium sp. YIC5082]MCZ7852729.1 ScpA family protein [Agrobacterium salinitolerans]MCZ7865844.1 ScpA family protein [Agrobacterium salinitolerans]MCZ7888061.1 ScpA family protein [Agrobacterium salinitolerans]
MAADKSRNSTPMDKLWQDVTPERLTGEAGLVIDVAGFEGPLDLLLHLARTQKVDLSRISVLALAEQYLQFVESARRVRIELAADYLVMAAWLAFLKSKLLIPQQSKDDGPSGEEMAATLAFRLKRLEAMREAAERLVNRAQLGRDVFARGAPEHIPHINRSAYEASLYDLLSAYANLRQRQAITQVTIEKRQVWSLVEARELLTNLLGDVGEWTVLDQYLLQYVPDPAMRVTAIASAFAASLELVREGSLQIRQEGAFQPIYMRRGTRDEPAASAGRSDND